MVSQLNNSPPVRDGAVGVLRKTVTFNDQAKGEIIVGALPQRAIVTSGSGVWVTTAFNGSLPAINIGIPGNATLFASALPLTSPVFVPFDDFGLTPAAPTSTVRNVVATISGTGSTVGACDVIVGIVA